jgi:DNA mismatch endonuclease (patch repair protein)
MPSVQHQFRRIPMSLSCRHRSPLSQRFEIASIWRLFMVCSRHEYDGGVSPERWYEGMEGPKHNERRRFWAKAQISWATSHNQAASQWPSIVRMRFGTNIMDQVTPAIRSRMMRAIRGKNTKPELQVRRALHAAGHRFRLHRKDLAGTPDVVLPRYRVAVQVNGCFWHRHECPRGRWHPSSNVDYWGPKLERNRRRRAAVAEALGATGWSVVTIWECNVQAGIDALLQELANRRRPDTS